MNPTFRRNYFLALLSIIAFTLHGCASSDILSDDKSDDRRYLVDYALTDNQLSLFTSQDTISIQFLDELGAEVHYHSTRDSIDSFALDEDTRSLKVKGLSLIDNEEALVYSSGKLSFHVHKKPLSIDVKHNGEWLFTDKGSFSETDTLQQFAFEITESELLMGGGERVLGMDRRGYKLQLYNRAHYGYQTHSELMYYSIPVVVSSKKYMLLYDNIASGWMDLASEDSTNIQFESVGGRNSYIVTASDSWIDLIDTYTNLTGKQPLLPRWSFGNISSRMGYRSRQQVEDVVDEYLTKNIPLDAMVLDLYWFGPALRGHMGNLDWDLEHFPRPEEMMQNLKDLGVKTVLITEPFILTSSSKYDELTEQNLAGVDSAGNPYVFDFFFGETVLLDIFKDETKEWFWDIYKRHTESGVDGWWGDLGEPEVHPGDMIHVNGTADEVHNGYGHEWTKMVFNGYRDDFPDERPFILMRSGFAGTQRYGILPWTGDVSRTWGGLKPQVELSLQMGLQGIGYMHSDIGGFAGSEEDSELYTRWIQFGAFTPVFRTHAQEDIPPEPVFWDQQTIDISRKYIDLRYKLTPYNYTLMYENHTQGLPLMRPLFYYDENPTLLHTTDTFLWGKNILVAPVIEKGDSLQTVTFPDSGNWINFWTGELYSGGQQEEVPVTIEDIPVFVKGGAFIPMIPKLKTLDEYRGEFLELHYYYDSEVTSSEDNLYADDGKTPDAVEQEQYELLKFRSENSEDKLIISLHSDGFNYPEKPVERRISLIIHGLETSPEEVNIDGEIVTTSTNKNNEKITIPLTFSGDKVIVEIVKR